MEIVERHFEKADSPLPGDLALFRYGRTISHGSIVIAWPQIIHAYITAGAVVIDDAIANQDLVRRLVGFWRLRQSRQGVRGKASETSGPRQVFSGF